jgi:hypothetical protein
MALKKINKLDAAVRQINTAILLWFSSDDEISVHTLACSAHQIVHDINQQNAKHELIYNNLNVKDEYRREANRRFKECYNFLKHADNDADDIIEFNPADTELFIMFTLLGLEYLGVKLNNTREAFLVYYFLSHPDFLTEKGRKTIIDPIPESQREQMLSCNRQSFLEAYLRLRNNMP